MSASRKRNGSSPSLGATSWLERAGDDLARIGGRTRSRGLTVTELKVAQLVAEGMSNREVAAALFVSEKTVEATVSRVLAKLAIRSHAPAWLGGSRTSRPPPCRPEQDVLSKM